MDPSYKPPKLFSDDSDSDEGYVPSKLDKGKRKAEGVSRADCVVAAETETGGALRAFGKGGGSRLPLSKFLSCTISSSRCLLFRLGHRLCV